MQFEFRSFSRDGRHPGRSPFFSPGGLWKNATGEAPREIPPPAELRRGSG